ncbi:MAG: MlaD family protein [Thermodesulfovibrionales bacterium]|jgi:phospholipid/cholesterol/gamma-HCH transport system substrate-binding protein
MFDQKKQLLWSKLRVGMVITLSILILFLTVFFSGGIETIVSPKVDLRVEIQDVKGLRKGAPVWLSGVEVGSVKEIDLNPAYGTVVTLSMNKDTLPFLKKDAHASVLTMGLLGDKYVELSAGSPLAGQIKPGDMIPGVSQIELKDVMATSAASIDKLTDFVRKLDHLVTKIDQGEGTIAKLIADPALYNNLKEASLTLSLVTKNIRDARGTMGQLIEDPSLYNKMLAATSSVEEFSKRLNSSSGTLTKLIEDPSLYDRVSGASSSLEEFSKKLTTGSGTLKKLTEDPALYENLNRSALQLSAVLEKIDKGEGVAGTLVGNKELAEELKEVVTEIRGLAKDIREHPTRYFSFKLF